MLLKALKSSFTMYKHNSDKSIQRHDTETINAIVQQRLIKAPKCIIIINKQCAYKHTNHFYNSQITAAIYFWKRKILYTRSLGTSEDMRWTFSSLAIKVETNWVLNLNHLFDNIEFVFSLAEEVT